MHVQRGATLAGGAALLRSRNLRYRGPSTPRRDDLDASDENRGADTPVQQLRRGVGHDVDREAGSLQQRPRDDARPVLRGWIHAVAAVGLLISAPVLWSAADRGGTRIAVLIYLIGVGAMLTVSATYHVPSWGPGAKRALRRADHSAIFLGIAGTYTPVLAVIVDGGFRLGMLATIWIGAAAGIAIANLLVDARPWLVATPYVVLGWVALLLLPAMVGWSGAMTALILLGGIAYTLGAVTYAKKWPDPWPRVFGFHEVFHLLTVVAVATHWAAIRLVLTS